jgi:predicted 3-demethylubiquinone-9 3-methyltransferase (glyoxalase superfamily)
MTSKITSCLWFNGQAEEAANFYQATFPDSHVHAIYRAPSDFPGGKQGDVLTVEFTVLGMDFLGLNGGPQFKFDEAVSFIVSTEDQAETDRYWTAIVDSGGSESECGWCKDRFGLSWQITPRQLTEFLKEGGERGKRAFEAMMTMKKIDIATLVAAVEGAASNA